MEELCKMSAEINFIFSELSEELVNKVPDKIKDFFNEMSSKTEYVANLNSEDFLDENKLLPETKTMLAILYRDYWANEQEKKEIEEQWTKNDEEYERQLREKYDIDNIFESRKKEKVNEDSNISNLPIKIENTNWFKKIINKILSLFSKNK